MMRRIRHCLLLASLGPVVAAAAEPEVVTVGVFLMAPFVMEGKDGPQGAVIDFFDREIAPRMGVKFKWERPMTTARLEQSLYANRVMFTPVLFKNEERIRKGIRFAGAMHIPFTPCVAFLADHPLKAITSPADMANMKIGWVQGAALPQFMLEANIQLDRIGSVDWITANLEKLRLRRVDGAYFSNTYTPRYYAAQTGLRLKVLPLPTPIPGLFGAFSPKAPAGLDQRYRRAAEEAFADGRFLVYIDKAISSTRKR